jgi:hypothetical protein
MNRTAERDRGGFFEVEGFSLGASAKRCSSIFSEQIPSAHQQEEIPSILVMTSSLPSAANGMISLTYVFWQTNQKRIMMPTSPTFGQQNDAHKDYGSQQKR